MLAGHMLDFDPAIPGGKGYARVNHDMFEPIVQLRRDEAAERRRRS